MSEYYVDKDGNVKPVPDARNMFQRVMSALNAGAVEYQRPGTFQANQAAERESLTSALNRAGEQQRGFAHNTSERLGSQQFTTGRDTNRQAFEAGESKIGREFTGAENKLRRDQDQAQFTAMQGLREMNRYDDIYDKNRAFITQQELLPIQRRVQESQIAENEAQARAAEELAKYRQMTSALDNQPITPEAFAIAQALQPRLQSITNMPAGMTYDQFRAMSAVRDGTSGQLPSLLGGQTSGIPAPAVPLRIKLNTSTNSP